MVSQNLCLDMIFENRLVRVINSDDLWFVLGDVCHALEMGNPAMVASRLDDDEKGITIIDTLGGPQEMLTVSEPGLYKILQRSNKPIARRFDRWARHEALPSIRKTGSYQLDGAKFPAIELIENLFDEKLQPVFKEFDDLKREIKAVGSNVVQLVVKGRRDPTIETQRMHAKVIRYHYFCLCPCGCGTLIMDDQWFISKVCTYHHQFNRWDNRPTATIPIAEACHRLIEKDAEARIRFGQIIFPHFQELLARLPTTQPRLPGM